MSAAHDIPPDTPLIELQDLCVKRGHLCILRDINLQLYRAEIVTIVGPNGSGKSTLLRSIIGALRPSNGSLTKARGLRIGYVPQKLSIDPSLPMSVERFMALPVSASKASIKEALEHAGVPELGGRQMAQLSGGQFQRVLLARALLGGPDVVLLDEASQGLDQAGMAAFYRRLEAVRRSMKCAILMVSHDLHVVMRASDRVICLNGHICCDGKPAQVAANAQYRTFFGTQDNETLAFYPHDHDHHRM